jgi:hypothetical protein
MRRLISAPNKTGNEASDFGPSDASEHHGMDPKQSCMMTKTLPGISNLGESKLPTNGSFKGLEQIRYS